MKKNYHFIDDFKYSFFLNTLAYLKKTIVDNHKISLDSNKDLLITEPNTLEALENNANLSTSF